MWLLRLRSGPYCIGSTYWQRWTHLPPITPQPQTSILPSCVLSRPAKRVSAAAFTGRLCYTVGRTENTSFFIGKNVLSGCDPWELLWPLIRWACCSHPEKPVYDHSNGGMLGHKCWRCINGDIPSRYKDPHTTPISSITHVPVFVFFCPDVEFSDRGHVLMSPEQCAFSFGSIDPLAEDEEDNVFNPWV